MRAPLLLLCAVTLGGCVSQGKYDDAVRSADDVRAQLQRVSAQEKTDAANAATLQSKLDEQTAINQQLRDELARLGKNADALLAEKGSLSVALDQSRQRLEELRRAKAASEMRAQLFHDIALRLKSMVDAGDLSIALRDGRMVLLLPNDVLFGSGQAEIQPRGRAALKTVASVLKTIPRRHFQIAGHTDSVPIETERFPSNWELSSARALEVTRFLIAEGVQPAALSAAAYADQDPIAANADERGRARNRRIEITVQPNIDELVYVPEAR